VTPRASLPLARLAFPVERTLGRRYPEPAHPYRNEFQRDRDRIVHSRAFRRLENKTQVFPSGISDHFRNRLTHTIEVSQIARTAASALGLNEDLTEALALVHDVGHPPFAHAGEQELNRQMQRFGETFNHNVHALRVVDAFEQRYARFPGLNLTFEVREGIVKHSRDLTPGADPELDEYLPALKPPLEAQLIDLADEIAYNTADLDDAYSARMFTLGDVRSAVPEFERLHDRIEAQFPGAPERVHFQEVVRMLIDELVSGLVTGTLERAEKAGVQDYEAVRRLEHRLAGFVQDETAARLKSFLHDRVYFAEPLVAERRRCAAMIGELFDYFLAQQDRLPENYVEEMANQPPHRIVCDYIAGMTDGFFMRCYEGRLSPNDTMKLSRPQ
jgi:dGTPase